MVGNALSQVKVSILLMQQHLQEKNNNKNNGCHERSYGCDSCKRKIRCYDMSKRWTKINLASQKLYKNEHKINF